MSPALRIQLFSEFSVTYGGCPVAGFTARSQALLAYLVLQRYTPQPRQRIAFHLWSDSTDAQARTNLRKELSYLRRNLPHVEQFLLVEAKTLQWSPTAPFTLDVLEFEAALKTAQTAHPERMRSLLEQAIQLYRDDLLPSCDDEWILPERERLQQLRIGALEQLINQLKQAQDYRTAIGYAQQLLRIDALNEATYVSLMQLHRLSGDRANALQTYHRCMTALREELGVDPSATTRKLYEQLLREDEPHIEESPVNERAKHESYLSLQFLPQATSSLCSNAPLVGREQEWKLIQQWINAIAPDPSSEVLLLVGEPGIGKTRLLEELRETIQTNQRQKGQVLWGRAFAAEMVRPYGIWIDALRSLALPNSMAHSSALSFLLPEADLSETAPLHSVPPDRSHLFDAVVRLLAEWAQSPLVIIFDDVQWIDEASLALLHYAIRLLSHLPVRFACAARTAELKENLAVSQVVQTLRRERRLKTIELSSLNRAQTTALIAHFNAVNSTELSATVADRVFVDSGGNPLFVLEVVRALSHNQSTKVDDLEALIGDRLQRLNATAQELLPWAAALGRSFKPAMVAQVANCPLTQLLSAIEQLEQENIIRPSQQSANELGYDFTHDVVRQVVYQQISEPRRQLIHLQIAHKLNGCSVPNQALSGDIAHHAALGGDHELAASAALLAAENGLKLFAYAEAATLAQRGVEHCQFLDKRTRIRLQLSLLRVIAIAGVTGDRAIQLEADVHQLMSEARQFGLKDDEALGFEALWVLYFNQSDFVRLEQYSIQAAEVSRAASPVTAAQLLAYSGSCLAEIGREMVRAEALLIEAQSLAARVGLQLCDIDSGLGSVHYYNGRYDDARPLLQQAWNISQTEQDHWRGYTYLSYLAMLELEAGDPTAALLYCEIMAQVAAKIQGAGSEGVVAAALTALAHYQLQRADADLHLQQAVLALQQVDAKRMLSYVLIGAAEIDLRRDRPQLALMRAKTALQAALTVNHPSEIALAWAISVQAAIASDDLEQAISQFQAQLNAISHHTLSLRARVAVEHIMQLMATTSSKFKLKQEK